MPKIFLDPKKDKIPQVGDKYVVKGVYPGSTNELWKPSVEVYLEPEPKGEEPCKPTDR
jgi:hypothetical protein